MKKHLYLVLTAGILLFAFLLPGQQEVYLRLTEGVPAISLAIPKFVARPASGPVAAAAEEIRRILIADLKYSRVFEPLPESYYNYIRPLDPDKVIFKDWESIQAKILFGGEASAAAGEDIVFEGKLYDVRAGKFIPPGKRYQGGKNTLRLMAHRMADEIMKIFGEKPIFTTKIVFVSDRDGNDELYMMDYDGANQTRLTFNQVRDYMPAWSADAKQIAFTSYRKLSAGLYLWDIYGGKTTEISTRGMNYAAAFSPDGKKLAFCSTRDKDGNAEIYVATSGGKEIRRLTFNDAIDTAPTWSSTSREIAFISDRGGTPQVYIMDAEGSNIRRVSFGGNHHDSPAWSPAGDRIVYISRVDNLFDLYILNLRSNQISKLTESNARNESPAWSPDGRHLVFSSTLSGSIQVYTIDHDGLNLRRLTSKGNNKLPDWSRQ